MPSREFRSPGNDDTNERVSSSSLSSFESEDDPDEKSSCVSASTAGVSHCCCDGCDGDDNGCLVATTVVWLVDAVDVDAVVVVADCCCCRCVTASRNEVILARCIFTVTQKVQIFNFKKE